MVPQKSTSITPRFRSNRPSDKLLRVMEIYGQTCQQRPHGPWEVSAPGEPTEWPAFEFAFNHQLGDDWQRRASSQVSVIVSGSTIPYRVRGKKHDCLWDATLESVAVECRELVAYFGVEASA